MSGFPDLSEVAFELSETQQLQDFEVLGFVPQPNLHLHHIFCEMVSHSSCKSSKSAIEAFPSSTPLATLRERLPFGNGSAEQRTSRETLPTQWLLCLPWQIYRNVD
ncbi:hypothetical protein [Nostoc sp. 106C]|uniref:hypothetical protein n=1 Tax=Nostoc sp. 106C TaxID=1932667 RepID=UPI000A39BECB|nr:hypothetical protein [Nostoc sp. 106C]OUL24660.1 hypothetical protein BV375_23810 [Nostoc sp. 106C]